MKFRSWTTFIAITIFNLGLVNAQTSIAQWNFNSSPPDNNTSTGTTRPNIGTGTLSTIGGVLTNFYAGSSADPASSDNSSLSLSSWATQGSANASDGLQAASSTVGFSHIVIALDFRQSKTVSRYFQLQVSSDGLTFENVSGGTATIGNIGSGNSETTFTTSGLFSNISSGNHFVQAISYTLPSGSVYENDPHFAFRWVAVYDPTNAGSYTASGAGSTYGTTGTGRFDRVTVSGSTITAVPEPAVMSLGAMGLLMLLSARQRKD